MLFVPSVVWGATTPEGQKAHENRAGRVRQSQKDAMALASAQDVTNAEEALKETVSSKPGSAKWHFELAQRMAQVSKEMLRKGRIVRPLVERALQHLELASSKAANSDGRFHASTKQLEGELRERMLGDLAGARKAYVAMQAYQPNSVRAREAITRLDEGMKNVERKGAGKP